VGGRYSDQWHVDHLINPQALVPESIMPPYAFLMNRELDGRYITDLMQTHQMVGVPYNDEMMEAARSDFMAQANPEADWDATDALVERYPGAQTRNFDGQPQVTEMDALVAYLQVLGTMVDFSTFTPDPSR
jgi:cytochrome c oxidase cbb3-type subunit 2